MTTLAVISVTLPFPPSGNTSVRHTRSGGHYRSAESVKYRNDVTLLCVGLRPLPGLVELDLTFYRGERNGRLVRLDLDNGEKVLIDSLQGKAFGNDSQVRRKTSEMLEDRARPRVEVRVRPYVPRKP